MDSGDKTREVDQWLDVALTQFGKSEPRAGLEGRVLASMRAERSRVASTHRWWWAAGATAAAVTIIAVVWLGRTISPGEHAKTSTVVPAQVATVATQPGAQAPARRAKKGTGHRAMKHTASALQAVAPKLETFPSPVPLTNQERLLARYVQEFPQRAALTARIQTELHQQAEREMAAPWPASPSSSDLEQKE